MRETLFATLKINLERRCRRDDSQLEDYPLLTGFRGAAVCDVAARDGLLRVSAMIEGIPQIAEVDCDPFVVHEHGGVILDARVRVESADPRPLIGVRR